MGTQLTDLGVEKKMKISIVRRNLLAVAVAAATADIRYYLNSVLVEVSPNETRIVATDGAILAMTRTDAAEQTTEPFSLMISTETISRIKSTGSDVLFLEVENGRHSIDGIAFVPGEGKFPDYRRVVPSSVSGEAGYYDPDLIARFAKIRKTLKAKGSMWIRQSGRSGPALVQLSGFEDFIGVVMPFRETEKAKVPAIPTWPQTTL